MKTIYLYGHLEEFAPSLRLDVRSAAEAVRALKALFGPRFIKALRRGEYYVQRHLADSGLTTDELAMSFSSDELHIIPAVSGAGGGKSKGIITAVLGVALIATAFIFAPAGAGLGATAFGVFGAEITFANIALFGVALVLSGVSSLLSPTPTVGDYRTREKPDERPSFLFNGPVNVTEQGGPVPLVYGEMITGSVVISAGLSAERIK